MAALWGQGGQAGQFPLEQWFYEMPPVTRWWTAATVATSVLVQCNVLTPYQLFYTFRAVYAKSQVRRLRDPRWHFAGFGWPRTNTLYAPQYWRLISTFLYFGPLNLDLLFHVFFMQRYSRLLEESSGRSPAHFSWMLVYAMASLLLIASFLSLPFLGAALSSSLVYVWSRRNPETRLTFLGVMVFTAPYLPWVLMGFSLVVHGTVPKDEICGVVVGHVWYFFNDVYPTLHGGHRPLDPPRWWRRLFDSLTGVDRDRDGDRPDASETTNVNPDFAAAAAREVR